MKMKIISKHSNLKHTPIFCHYCWLAIFAKRKQLQKEVSWISGQQFRSLNVFFSILESILQKWIKVLKMIYGEREGALFNCVWSSNLSSEYNFRFHFRSWTRSNKCANKLKHSHSNWNLELSHSTQIHLGRWKRMVA